MGAPSRCTMASFSMFSGVIAVTDCQIAAHDHSQSTGNPFHIACKITVHTACKIKGDACIDWNPPKPASHISQSVQGGGGVISGDVGVDIVMLAV